ncbi:MAG TPA: adenylosuccinate lyase [Bacteroidales bacterium]|nr:adenylosuccinate lyase [Bacteroidales bacterium]HPI86836.1 adenylosuccinate lyase [Bacteroidales bacterium]
MELTSSNAISPVDGRYRKQTEPLAYYFSEAAYINYRVFVEIEYFIALCNIPLPQLKDFDRNMFEELRAISRNFTFADAEEVKQIEKTTNHDVKAVEYYVKKRFEKLKLKQYKEFVHFGLTSQDINNTAVPYATRLALHDVLLPLVNEVEETLTRKAKEWKEIPMLARTHGQPASPTRLGKEIYVFADRLKNQLSLLKTVPFGAKFGGATGNFNAHKAAYPEIDWAAFGDQFVNKSLGLTRQKVTTQIEHYDNLAALFDNLRRINTILIDLCRDMWTYISMDYFKQKIKADEVGSSAMPHKVNPIDFENAEGNFGMANAIFSHLAEKLPISRLQRDLTDSTVIRNIGVPIGHMMIAIKSLLKGLEKVILNEEKIKADLQDNWPVIAEAIQTILRRENYPDPYEKLKKLTRTNKKIDKASFHHFIDGLKIPEKLKIELKKITPENYTGIDLI